MLCTVLVLTLATCLAVNGKAQVGGSGNIQGTVTDATGAVIPNATVTLTSQTTQVSRTAKTDTAGDYVFPNLTPDTYSVTASLSGFQTFTSTGNVLEVGSSISINVKMTVGAQDQKVEV